MNGLRYVGATSVSRSGSRWLVEARTWYPEHSAWGVGGGKGRDGRVSQRTHGMGEGNVYDVKGVTGVGRGAVNRAAGPGRPGVWGSGAKVGLGGRGLGAGLSTGLQGQVDRVSGIQGQKSDWESRVWEREEY
jgi:hypothetical protein